MWVHARAGRRLKFLAAMNRSCATIYRVLKFEDRAELLGGDLAQQRVLECSDATREFFRVLRL